MADDTTTTVHTRRWRRRVTIWTAIALVTAVGLGALRLANSLGPNSFGLDDQAGGSLAIIVVLGAPALTALVGRSGRPGAVTAAGFALVPLGIISPVALPITIVGIAFIVLGLRSPSVRTSRPDPRDFAVGVAVAILHIGAFAALIVHADPRSVTHTDGSGARTSDVVTWPEVGFAIACATGAVLLAKLAFTSRTGSTISDPSSRGDADKPARNPS